ncbi:DUF3152 domain-containing protein [Nocardioides sp. TF02-7]|uniref:DUF3152 domain-containing protein n=1 Tax=Nocardioides sp. TF02-7 TaxID=2917724 RepID=UPI001F0606CC|nr:DUF3152 domain-containing protein [Nocardioides sp. TF02-7]UMG92251.1 DUF3152 domain-containing protein [Nocardioides sp. TF02-7]
MTSAADPSRIDAETGPATPTATPTLSGVPLRTAKPSPRASAQADGRPDRRKRRPSSAEAGVRVPEEGPGRFEIAPGSTGSTGAGQLVTYTVEVEVGVPLAARKAAGIVDATLTDPRGWTAGDTRALQRVAGDADVRVLLATPGTTDALCAPLDTGGRLSCRNGGLVVLNAWRWVNGAATYDDLDDYRRYLVNHEFGHALGNDHEYCPNPGDPAPVMVQQTKSLEGCRPNPWPFP